MIKIDTREPDALVGKVISETSTDLVKVGATTSIENNLGNQSHPADIELHKPGQVIGIQRKTVSDFVGSIGKLKPTMKNLRELFDVGILLIEGGWRVEADRIQYYTTERKWRTGPRTAGVQNFLYSQMLRGSPVINVGSIRHYETVEENQDYNMRQTAKFISNLYAYNGPTINTVQQGSPVKMLTQIPGIGKKTAANIFAEYGSLKDAIGSVDSWDEIDGIGRKTVEDAIKYLQ